MSLSKLNSCFGVGGSGGSLEGFGALSVLGFVIGLYPSWNCSGSGNMVSSLTLFCGTSLGFTLSHFPALGGGVGFFHWLINNLINCPLVSFLRSFFSISILYNLVFKSFFPYLYYMVLSLNLFG